MGIFLILGPMSSGKSTELLRRARRAAISKGKTIMRVKYAGDKRYSEGEIVTHDGVSVRAIAVENLSDLAVTDSVTDIYIDEGQFFSDIEIVDEWADQGIDVHIAALDSDFKREPFGDIWKLLCKCEDIIKLNAICTICGANDAPFTMKLNGRKDAQTDIGGLDKYQAACRKCHVVYL